MDERVKQYLEKKEAEKVSANQAAYEKEKRELLGKLKMYDVVYSDVSSPEFPYKEFYGEVKEDGSQDVRYFKHVYWEVSDEEFEKIKSYEAGKTTTATSNAYAKTIKIIGIIAIALGLISGLMVFEYFAELALSLIVICGVQGVLLLGFSEVIALLDSINKK